MDGTRAIASGGARQDPGRKSRERGIERRRVDAAALRHVGAPAALAADLRRNMGNDIARLYLTERATVDTAGQSDLAVGRRGEENHAVDEPLLQSVDAFAERLRVEPVDARRDDAEARDLVRLSRKILRRRVRGL